MKQNGGYILGIDQGGTKTAAAVMTMDGLILGQAVAKGSYFPVKGMETAMGYVEEAVDRALGMASVGREDIAYTVAGITGVDWPGDDTAVEEALRKRHFSGELFVCNDVVIALYSGTFCSHGAVICAGTGMNGALVDREGRQFVFGDYMEEAAQGGTALALRAARKVFDAAVGLCGPTALTDLFLSRTKTPDVDELLHRYMTEEGFQSSLRYLVPEIMAAAERGDAAACEVLDAFSAQIVDYIDAGFRKMKMDPATEEIVLAGNVFKGADNPLARRVTAGVRERLAGAQIVLAHFDPVVGACVMGLVRAGLEPAERVENLKESAGVLGLCRN